MIERLKQLDKHADELYPRILATVKVNLNRNTGEIVPDDAGSRLLRFGLPDLIFRLECQCEREAKRGTGQDAIAHAKIWRHVVEACKPGEQIGDITDNTQLNPWLSSSHPKFTKPLPARNCESCGLPWDACENHQSRNCEQQADPTKTWLCHWCLAQPQTRHRYKVHTSERGSCASCGVPWELVGVGGHIPVSGSDEAWQCADCFRLEKITGKLVAPTPSRTCPCASQSCGRGPGLTRARVPARGECCSDACRNVVKSVAARANSRKTAEKVSTVWHSREGSPQQLGLRPCMPRNPTVNTAHRSEQFPDAGHHLMNVRRITYPM